MIACVGRGRKLLGTKNNDNKTTAQKLATNSGHSNAYLARGSLFSSEVSAAWQQIHPFFERWASSFPTSNPRHHRETFSRAVCPDQACHSLVVSWELIWTDGFSLWLPEMMKTFLEGRISTDQWSDIPLAHWTESLFSEALGESCLLTLNWGMLVVWWEREKDWVFFSCPWHCCFFVLFSEVSLGQGFSASSRKCHDWIFLSMFSHGRYCICCEELV